MKKIFMNVYFLLVTLIIGLRTTDFPDLNFEESANALPNNQPIQPPDEVINNYLVERQIIEDIERVFANFCLSSQRNDHAPDWTVLHEYYGNKGIWYRYCQKEHLAWSEIKTDWSCDQTPSFNEYMISFHLIPPPNISMAIDVMKCVCRNRMYNLRAPTFFLTVMFYENRTTRIRLMKLSGPGKFLYIVN